MTTATDYILGTHDEEIARLGVQHRAWRPSALAAWKTAGIASGQVVLDVGCGPGYATLDLAELTGPSGKVLAVDKSEKFLNALDAQCRTRRIQNITTHRADLDMYEFAGVNADAAWCRWVFAFVTRPKDLLARLTKALRPGGVIVVHEYFHYATWQTIPSCPELEEFVRAVMTSWRHAGGEPDIGLSLPPWFEEMGFEVRSTQPILEIVQKDHPKWGWMRAFADVGRQRLVDLGFLTAARADAIWQAFQKIETAPRSRMISPAVLEIVAQKCGPA